MLYKNEIVEPKLYDPETGREYVNKFQEEEETIAEILQQGRALTSLRETEGWRLIQGFLESSITYLKDKLVYEVDTTKIFRFQEAIKSYSNVVAFIDWKINEAKALEDKQRTPEMG